MLAKQIFNFFANSPIRIYSIFFIIAFIFSFLVGYVLLKFLKNVGTRTKNGNENLVRWASQAKPAIGGFIFFILFLLSVCSHFILPFEQSISNKELFALVGTSSLGFLVGLIDDSFIMSPLFKLIGQLACAAIIIFSGIYINISGVFIIDALFTTFWVVGIMNSINMLDNMDGITASISWFIIINALIINCLQSNPSEFYNTIYIGVLAALTGFLCLNWYPAKMYMGDTGSQFLGVFLAFIAIQEMWTLPQNTPTQSIYPFLLPAIAFLIPIIDTTTVSIYRIYRKQSPLVGGRDHTTHHLVYCGFKDQQVAIIFVLLAALSVPITFWLISTQNKWHTTTIAYCAIYCILIFILIQYWYLKGKKNKNTSN